ncbi:MAG: flagellin [Acidobacteriota bacterium]
MLFGAAGVTIDIAVGISGTTTNDILSINTSGLDAVGLGVTATGTGQAVTTSALLTKAGAQAEFAKIKAAIDNVSSRRGTLGATLNRLTSTIEVVSTQSQNLLSAQSAIQDADTATEITNLTKFQVLQQTGLAALAQANTASQAVLSLLR